MKESTLAKIGLAVGAIGALAALGDWLLPGGFGPFLATRENVVAQKTSDRQAEVQSNAETKHPQAKEPEKHPERADEIPRELLRPAPNRENSDPKSATTETWKAQTFTLADQEQKTIVPGCASLAVDFHEVADVDFVTVRINMGEESTPHAVSSAGERFKLNCGANDYFVSVLLIDRAAGMVRVGLEKINS